MAVDEKDRSSAAFLSHMESVEDPPVITRSIFDRSGSISGVTALLRKLDEPVAPRDTTQ
jgi:hypothetical protein